MTRDEQIIQASDEWTYQKPPQYSELVHKTHKVMCAYQVGFIDGAVWADKHPQKAAKGKRSRWVSADTQPKATGYYVTEDKRGALAVCLWNPHGWHYAWAPVVRWLDMKLEKEK